MYEKNFRSKDTEEHFDLVETLSPVVPLKESYINTDGVFSWAQIKSTRRDIEAEQLVAKYLECNDPKILESPSAYDSFCARVAKNDFATCKFCGRFFNPNFNKKLTYEDSLDYNTVVSKLTKKTSCDKCTEMLKHRVKVRKKVDLDEPIIYIKKNLLREYSYHGYEFDF